MTAVDYSLEREKIVVVEAFEQITRNGGIAALATIIEVRGSTLWLVFQKFFATRPFLV